MRDLAFVSLSMYGVQVHSTASVCTITSSFGLIRIEVGKAPVARLEDVNQPVQYKNRTGYACRRRNLDDYMRSWESTALI